MKGPVSCLLQGALTILTIPGTFCAFRFRTRDNLYPVHIAYRNVVGADPDEFAVSLMHLEQRMVCSETFVLEGMIELRKSCEKWPRDAVQGVQEEPVGDTIDVYSS